MHCHKCGKENKEGAKFCIGCGTKLKAAATKTKPEKTKDKREEHTKKPEGKWFILPLIIISIILIGVVYASTAKKTLSCTVSVPYTEKEA